VGSYAVSVQFWTFKFQNIVNFGAFLYSNSTFLFASHCRERYLRKGFVEKMSFEAGVEERGSNGW